MVDKDKIRMDLKRYFAYHGEVDIDDQGVVSCTGSVELTARMSKLPVQFAVVDQDFKANHKGLKSLMGAPHTVGGAFSCWANPLTTLQGGPRTVKQEMWAIDCKLLNLLGAPSCAELFVQHNPLTSLEGMPEHVTKLGVTYDPHLPLLRSLLAQHVVLYNDAKGSLDDDLIRKALTCQHILNDHAGAGKKMAIVCAAKLVKAGCKGNAQW